MRMLLIVSLMILAGCTPMSPEKQAAFNQCNYEADKATGGNSDAMMGTINNFSIWKDCMAAKGY